MTIGSKLQRKAGRFYPTRLALNITNKNAVSTISQDDETEQDKGYLIVETNYRVSTQQTVLENHSHTGYFIGMICCLLIY